LKLPLGVVFLLIGDLVALECLIVWEDDADADDEDGEEDVQISSAGHFHPFWVSFHQRKSMRATANPTSTMTRAPNQEF